MKNAKLFSINQFDLIKGAFLAAIVAIITTAYNSLQASKLPTTWTDWKPILIFGLTTFIGYLLKNLLSNSNGLPLTKENNDPPKA